MMKLYTTDYLLIKKSNPTNKTNKSKSLDDGY